MESLPTTNTNLVNKSLAAKRKQRLNMSFKHKDWLLHTDDWYLTTTGENPVKAVKTHNLQST